MPRASLSVTGSLWVYLAGEWQDLANLCLQVIYGVFFTIPDATSSRVIIPGAESVHVYGPKRRSHREFRFFWWIQVVYLVCLMVWTTSAAVIYTTTANLAGFGTESSGW